MEMCLEGLTSRFGAVIVVNCAYQKGLCLLTGRENLDVSHVTGPLESNNMTLNYRYVVTNVMASMGGANYS